MQIGVCGIESEFTLELVWFSLNLSPEFHEIIEKIIWNSQLTSEVKGSHGKPTPIWIHPSNIEEMSITYKIFPRKIPQKYINFNLHSNNNFTDKKNCSFHHTQKPERKFLNFILPQNYIIYLYRFSLPKKGTILGKTNDSKNSFN